MKLKIDLKLKIKNLKLAPAFPVIARAMSAARGNLAKRLKRSRRLQISLVTLAIFTPLALLGLWLGREKAIASWYDDNFSYRQTVAITNSGSSQTDYQIPISLDTATLITAGKMRSDCYDIRVTDYSGALLPLWIETGTNACNTATTQIWVKVPSVPTPNNVLLIYYGNSTVTTGTNGHGPSSADAGKAVFEFFDDFDTMDSSKWTLTGSPTVAGGATALTNGQTLVSTGTVTSSSGLARVIARVKQAATTQTAGKIGFYNTNDAASIGFGNLEEKLTQIVPSNIISHHKLEETTTTDANQFKASGYLDTGKLSQAVSVYGNTAQTTGSFLSFNRGSQISGNNYEHFDSNQGSINIWVKPSWNGGDSLQHSFVAGTIQLFKHSDNLLYCEPNGAAPSQKATISASGVWTAGSWYHIVCEWDADNTLDGTNYIKLYVNGSNTGATNYASPLTTTTPSNNWNIGASLANTYHAQSLIDDFAIFDRVLTTTEITNIYNSGTGREAGYVADSSLKFYAKMDGSGTLSPVTYNGGASASKMQAASGELTGGTNLILNSGMEAASGGNATSWGDIQGTATKADAETANILFDTRSQKLTFPGDTTLEYGQVVSLTGGSTYTYGFWYKSEASSYIYPRFYNTTSSVDEIAINQYITNTAWTRWETTFKVTGTGAQSIKVGFRKAYGSNSPVLYVDNVSLTPNLVDNGGMEGGANPPAGWTQETNATVISDTTPHSGTNHMKITAGAANVGAKQSITLVSGTSYLVSAWTKATSTNTAVLAFDAGSGSATNITTTTSTSYVRLSGVVKATGTAGVIYLRASANADVVWFDDVSVIPLDNTALSFQAWAPTNDTASANPLSIHGGTSGVASNTSGKLNNAYTFDGSTGYLRQKTYLTNIGTLSYGTNALTDTGQTFTSYKASPATYMIVVTNSDNTTSWGYIGTTSGATIVDVFTTKALSVAGWNGTSPSGKTPVGYEVRKTDFQITGNQITLGAWFKTTSTNYQDIIGKREGSNEYWLATHTKLTGRINVVSAPESSTSVNDGNWHFGVLSYNGTTYKTYLDGVEATSTNYSSNIGDMSTALGIGYGNGNFFNGSIDSPFVLNTALTADQIAALYQYHSLATTNNSTISVINGSATPTNDTNYHTYLMTAGSSSTTAASDNTVFATSSTNLPNEAVNLRLMNSDSTNALTVDWVAVAKQASTAPTVAAPASEEKGGAPVAYWKFDDGTGTNAQDSSPNGNDGTITGATWQTSDLCVSDKCLKFDGSTARVDAGDPANGSLDFGTGDFSTSFWLRTGDTTSNKRIIAKRNGYNGDGTDVGYEVYISNGTIGAFIGDGGGFVTLSSTSTYNDNKWHHVAINFTRSSTAVVYKDGVAVGSVSIAARSATISNSKSFILGRDTQASPSNYFNGFMDDVKIYNYARTAAQVKSDFNSRGASKGLALRTQGQALTDGLSNGLVGYWKMDESSWTNDCSTASVLDSSGNANNGKSCPNGTGITTPAAGKFGLSGSFDGGNDYVEIADSTSLDVTNSITVAGWVKSINNLDRGYLLYKGSNPGSYALEVDGDGTLRYRITNSTGTQFTNSIDTGPDITTWTHVVMVYDIVSQKLNLYRDGTLQLKDSVTINSLNNTGNLTIGNYYQNTGADYDRFAGSIDEVRIYNRALSPREVRDLYAWAPGPVGYWPFDDAQGSSVVDKSGNGNNGTWAGTLTSQWTTGKYGNAGKFNATNNNVSANSSIYAISNAVTLEAWIYPTSLVSSYDIIGNSNTWDYRIYLSGNCPVMQISLDNGNTGYHSATCNLAINNWYHIVGVFDGNTVKIYKNGILILDEAAVGSIQTPGSSINIGSYGSGDWFPGKIDEVKIYNYARTAKQIVEDMNGGHPAGGSPVGSQVGYWKFDEGYGTVANNSGNTGAPLNGTITSGTWSNSGKFGKAVNYNGTSSTTSVSSNTALNLNNFTVSFWMNATNASGTSTIEQTIDKAVNNTDGKANYIFSWSHTDSTFQKAISFYDGTATWYKAKINSTMNPNTWYHVVGTYDGSNLKIYLNGNLETSTATTATPTTGNYSLAIGSGLSSNSPTNYYKGLLDEVKIYNYALTSDEIKTDYNHGLALALGGANTIPTAIASDTFTTASSTTTEGYPTYTWTGSTWTVASGTVSNSPTLGSELAVDNNASSTQTELDATTGWSIKNGASLASITDNRPGSLGTKAINSVPIIGGNISIESSYSGTANLWYKIDTWYKNGTGGRFGLYDYSNAAFFFTNLTETAWTEKVVTFRSGSASKILGVAALNNSGPINIDDFSIKPLTLSSLFRTINASKPDVTVEAAVTGPTSTSGVQGGLVLNLDSTSSPANFIIVYLDGAGNVKVDEAVAGVYTNKASTAITYSAGATLRAVKSGNSLTVYYNGAQVGSTLTMTSNSNTNHGLFSTYSGNTFDNFVLQSSHVDYAYCVPGGTDPCSAPVGEWNFEEGSGGSAQDSSGNGNTGTATGTTIVPGKIGKARSFNGSSDFVQIANKFTFSNNPFTISYWLYLRSDVSRGGFYQRKSSSPFNGVFLGKGSPSTVGCNLVDTSANTISATVAQDLNQWVKYDCVYNPTTKTATLYRNGVQASTNTNSSFTNVLDESTQYAPQIAQRDTGSFIDANMDQIKVYNYARTPAQVAWDYNKGAPVAQYKMDECQGATIHNSQVSSTNLDGTITIGASGTQTSVGNCSTASTAWGNGVTGKYNSSLNFDGTDDVVTVANTIANAGTVSFWVYPTSNTASMMQLTSSANITASSGTLSATGFTSPTIYVNGRSGGSLTASAWNHIVVTTATSISANAIKLGLVGSTYFAGQIDDVRIYNYALTAAQIKTLYNQNSAIRFGPQTGSP